MGTPPPAGWFKSADLFEALASLGALASLPAVVCAVKPLAGPALAGRDAGAPRPSLAREKRPAAGDLTRPARAASPSMERMAAG